jgi:hypothetical protein
MPYEIQSLIHEVYRQADLHSMLAPFVTRLVKLIYLADLEWRRAHGGEPLADLTWKFLHFGPYAIEFAEVLADPDMEMKELDSGIVARRFDFTAVDLERPRVPEPVSAVLSKIVKKWGDADLNTLLDFVYFETEPMEHARRGELLDFSAVKMPEAPRRLQVDVNRLKTLRQRMADTVKRLGFTRNGVHVPAVDMESEHAWAEEDRPVLLPIGRRVQF